MSSEKQAVRSNTSGGRRRACVLCRDRKVRCDGQQPSCQRCVVAGETCVYATPSKLSKADMLNTINELRGELEESNQQHAFPNHQQFASFVSPDIFSTVASGSSSSLSSVATNPSSNLFDDSQIRTTSRDFVQPQARTDDAWAMMGYDLSTTDIPVDPSIELRESNSNGGLSGNGLVAPFAPMTAADAATDTDRQQYGCQSGQSLPGSGTSTQCSRLPSLRDIRAAGQQRPRSSQATEQLLGSFVEDVSRTMAAQYNIIGIADTVAHYSSYFNQQNARQSPGANPSELLDGNQKQSLVHFLAVLEHRMREVGEIASDDVLKQIVRSLKSLAAQGMVPQKAADLEDEQIRQARRSTEFFDTSYDIEQPLAKQSGGLQTQNSTSSIP